MNDSDTLYKKAVVVIVVVVVFFLDFAARRRRRRREYSFIFIDLKKSKVMKVKNRLRII